MQASPIEIRRILQADRVYADADIDTLLKQRALGRIFVPGLACSC
jgi:hypothetical protein